MKHRIRVGVLIMKEDKILLVKHVHPETKYEFWVPPGGGIEEKDPWIFECAKREVWEETGLEVTLKKNFRYIREFYDKERHTLNLELFLEADAIKGDLTIENIYGNGIDEDYIKGVEWISKDDVKELEVFPEIIKEGRFWEEQDSGRTEYLGRQKG